MTNRMAPRLLQTRHDVTRRRLQNTQDLTIISEQPCREPQDRQHVTLTPPKTKCTNFDTSKNVQTFVSKNEHFHRQVLDTDITEVVDEHKMDDSVFGFLVLTHGGSQRLRRERARCRQATTDKILLKFVTQ